MIFCGQNPQTRTSWDAEDRLQADYADGFAYERLARLEESGGESLANVGTGRT
jgi:hypothetical protein